MDLLFYGFPKSSRYMNLWGNLFQESDENLLLPSECKINGFLWEGKVVMQSENFVINE